MENYHLIEEKQNHLFNRKEIKFSLTSKATPNKIEVGKLISEKFSSEPEKINIKKIGSTFGTNKFTVNADIYSSKENKEKLERKKKKGIKPAAEEEKKPEGEN